MKIYDCFTFYNELELLDLRLAELYAKVDYFVLVEATTTFQNRPKDLYYKDNEHRYRQYSDKIIHVVVDDMPMNTDPWQNERFQRDAILRGLVNADSEDIAIISDVDEFIRPETVDYIRQNPRQAYGLRMPYFNFKFNYMLINDNESYCVWATAGQVGALTSPEDLRRSRWVLHQLPYNFDDGTVAMLEHAGWHFTYIGDDEFIKNKIKSFAHSELNTAEVLNSIDVKSSIAQQRGFNPHAVKQFVMVNLDDYFPLELRERVDQYRDYVIFGSDDSARNFLPK
jgi:hypothetical protein